MRQRKGSEEMTMEMWIPIYKCKLCGREVENTEPAYNHFGMTQFPKVNAPDVIAHKCKRGTVGLAELIGLHKVPNKENQ
jgi:hypothetical protein